MHDCVLEAHPEFSLVLVNTGTKYRTVPLAVVTRKQTFPKSMVVVAFPEPALILNVVPLVATENVSVVKPPVTVEDAWESTPPENRDGTEEVASM